MEIMTAQARPTAIATSIPGSERECESEGDGDIEGEGEHNGKHENDTEPRATLSSKCDQERDRAIDERHRQGGRRRQHRLERPGATTAGTLKRIAAVLFIDPEGE